MTKRKYVTPDGGWGWVIVFAFALNNIAVIPIIQNFGMIYGSAFKVYGISATESTLIMNVNQAFGMLLGMMNGPLLRKYGYRKVAIVSTLLYSSGVILTSFASSLIHFIITYGMLTSLGMTMVMSSFSLAVNTYFKEKRGRAMGWAMTITGLGPIFAPYFITFLLLQYGHKSTMLILGGLSLNSLIGALFLHPIKWHAKPVKETSENFRMENENNDSIDDSKDDIVNNDSTSLIGGSKEKSVCDIENCAMRNRTRIRAATISSLDFSDDNVSIYGFEIPLSMQNGSILDIRGTEEPDYENASTKEERIKLDSQLSRDNGAFEFKRSNSFNETKVRKISIGSRYRDLGLAKKVLADFPEEEGESTKTNDDDSTNISMIPTDEAPEIDKPLIKRIFIALNKFFDLDLLRDPVYVNIMLGMSLAIFAELNFSTLTPFILNDMQLTDSDIANVMSSIATTDLLLRAVAPYIGECLRKSPRIMYLFSLFLLITARTGLLVAKNFYTLIVVALGLGVAKGFRTVYMVLVIPSHVPLEKLANASSIQSLVNGFFLMLAGPCLGLIRDLTGHYIYCIILINCVTAITILLWVGEFATKPIMRILRQRKQGVN